MKAGQMNIRLELINESQSEYVIGDSPTLPLIPSVPNNFINYNPQSL